MARSSRALTSRHSFRHSRALDNSHSINQRSPFRSSPSQTSLYSFLYRNCTPSFAVLILRIATGAYLGAAPLINDSNLLAAAASIMCVEARQASMADLFIGQNAFSTFE